MSDVVERLRQDSQVIYLITEPDAVADLSKSMSDAADEIERLRARVAELEAAIDRQQNSRLNKVGSLDAALRVAIAQERERCAKVAEACIDPTRPQDARGDWFNLACKEIAAKIRSGE